MPANQASAANIRAQIAQAVYHQQRGAYPDAQRLFRAVLAADPRQADALHYLGLLAYQTGHPEQAVDLMQRSITESPGNPTFYYNLAGVLQKLGRGQEAVPMYQRCLDLQHDNGDAWQGLAETLQTLGHPEDAVACLERACIYAPRHSGCWATLAEAQDSLGLLPEAVNACRQAVEISPRDPKLRVQLARHLAKQGCHGEALELLNAIIAMAPPLAPAHFERAVLYAILGQFEEARRGFEATLALKPDLYAACFHFAAIKKFGEDEPMVKRLEAAAERGQWNEPTDGINVHFTLGKIRQDQGQYQRAFTHFAVGNKLRRGTLHYSGEEQRKLVQQIKLSFDKTYLQRMSAAGQPTKVPIFIVGMSRSGTTLTEQILSRHPQVYGGGELNFMHAALRRRLGFNMRLNYVSALMTLSAADLRLLGEQYLKELRALAPAARRITDKMPSNFMLLGLIHAVYPSARIIHCRRDPLDNCLSLFTTLFESGHFYTSDLTELGEFYRLYADIMQHWRLTLPTDSMLEIDYEELVVDTETQARRMLKHCGLDWDPVCLQFKGDSRGIRTASLYQARQPIYCSSIGRWKHYEYFLDPLKTALGIQT